MKTKKTKLFNFRVDADFVRRLNRVAQEIDIPASQLARQAVAEKVTALESQSQEKAA